MKLSERDESWNGPIPDNEPNPMNTPENEWIEKKIDEWMQQGRSLLHSEKESWLRNALTTAYHRGQESESNGQTRAEDRAAYFRAGQEDMKRKAIQRLTDSGQGIAVLSIRALTTDPTPLYYDN